MDKRRHNKIKEPRDQNSLEPILQINEFEEAAGAILDLAKDQTTRNIQAAKDKAVQIIQQQKEILPALEKEYLQQMEEELNLEKEKLILKTKEELQHIQTIPEEKIKQAVNYVLERIIPQKI